ncbi:MAG TPA: amino acid ABC transporter permease [Stellaceae bacterium]|nr:amino acid ABC transporter permease [Stellaceae bacterium]
MDLRPALTARPPRSAADGHAATVTATDGAPGRRRLRIDGTDVVSFVLGAAILVAVASAIKWSFVATLDPGVLLQYWRPLLRGALTTLAITGAALAVGLAVGILLAVLQQLPIGPARWLILVYVEVWRNTPLIVQLFWIHFGLPLLTGISTTAFASGFLALALQSSAYLADIARAGIQAVPRGQWEAARALGLPAVSLWGEIVLPQALRVMIPPFTNLALSFLNGSALLGLLQVGELMTAATRISDYTFKPIEVMSAAGLLYLLLNLAIGRAAQGLERLTAVPR